MGVAGSNRTRVFDAGDDAAEALVRRIIAANLAGTPAPSTGSVASTAGEAGSPAPAR
ncbi:MAG: hypothetical protein R3E68_14060 [Burkholderiaceae bacterium]